MKGESIGKIYNHGVKGHGYILSSFFVSRYVSEDDILTAHYQMGATTHDLMKNFHNMVAFAIAHIPINPSTKISPAMKQRRRVLVGHILNDHLI